MFDFARLGPRLVRENGEIIFLVAYQPPLQEMWKLGRLAANQQLVWILMFAHQGVLQTIKHLMPALFYDGVNRSELMLTEHYTI